MEADGITRALARAAVACVAAAVVVLAVVVVFFHGLTLLVTTLSAAVLTGFGVWWFLARRGFLRWFGAALAAAAPVGLVVAAAVGGFWFDGLVVALLWVAGVFCARAALRRVAAAGAGTAAQPRFAAPPRRPVLIMNPESGDGKVGEFGLVEKAEDLGARVVVWDPSEDRDVAEIAREAVEKGADLLGVAGGDGTQALVAAVAAEHGLPFLVLSAGTRNHFAMDLGLDRDDPAAGLDALRDGVELRVDLGMVSGRPFVNTASFGAYAQIVQSPEYRGSKAGAALNQLPDLLSSNDEAPLDVTADDDQLPNPQILLVSNNPYVETGTLGGGRRPRLDTGLLGVVAVHMEGALDAAQLTVLGTAAQGVTVRKAREVRIDAEEATIPVALDGEALTLDTPVTCSIRPGALRVRVPRDRPGATPRPLKVEWRSVLSLALGRFGTDRPRRSDQ